MEFFCKFLTIVVLLQSCSHLTINGEVMSKKALEQLSPRNKENQEYLSEKVIARRKRAAKPVSIFKELASAINWLATPLSIEEQQAIERIASGVTPTEDDIRILCREFEGECRVTQTTRYNGKRLKREAYGGGKTRPNAALEQASQVREDQQESLGEKVIARSKRAAKPVSIFSELASAITWLATPLTIEEQQTLERIATGATPTEEDVRTLCRGFQGECRVTQTTRYNGGRQKREAYGAGKTRQKRFVAKFIEKLLNPNGRLATGNGRAVVNADANWSPRIPSVYAGREQQNIYGASQSSTGYPVSSVYSVQNYFNENDSNVQSNQFSEYYVPSNGGQFNEYNSNIKKGSEQFDEHSISSSQRDFNEYTDTSKNGGWYF